MRGVAAPAHCKKRDKLLRCRNNWKYAQTDLLIVHHKALQLLFAVGMF